jgi:DNA polymerase-3 subunit gamma/tau
MSLQNSLRPNNLNDMIGWNNDLKNMFESGRIPHFFLIKGSTGTGKTTISRIISRMLQYKKLEDIDYGVPLGNYDITEINAADKNGVDDIRELIEKIKYKPHEPSLSKVIIMDEAH